MKPLAAAADKANTALLRADWSPGVRPDIRSLVDVDATTVADISTAYMTTLMLKRRLHATSPKSEWQQTPFVPT